VALGVVTDVGGTVVFDTLIAVVYATVLAKQGVGASQIAALIQDQSLDTSFGLLATVGGLGFSYLGGLVCARIARRSELRYAAITAVLNTLAGLALSGGQMGLPKLIGTTVLSIAVVLLGAVHGRARNKT
jgi:hypothetical protein